MQFSYIMYVIKIYSIKVFLAMRLLFSEVDILIYFKDNSQQTTDNGGGYAGQQTTDNRLQTTEEATPDNRQQTTDYRQRGERREDCVY